MQAEKITGEPPLHKRIVSRMEAQDYAGACALASEFCKRVGINYNDWLGVPPKPGREAQVRQSINLLREFSTQLPQLDDARWRVFQAQLQKPSQRVFPDFHLSVSRAIHRGDILSEWHAAANVELVDFFAHINTNYNFNDENFLRQLPEIISSEMISGLVSSFLKQHVGEGERKVQRDRIEGFDGTVLSCPISRAKVIGMRFFAVTAAEYLWMNAIGYHDIRSEKDAAKED